MATFYCYKKDAVPFSRANIDHMVPTGSGIYIFWANKFCLYVGQSQSLRNRLLQHWSNCHNVDLKIWIAAKGKGLCINYYDVDRERLTDVEQSYIDRFQPHLNLINARRL